MLTDLTLKLFHETDRAILVGEGDTSDKAVWLPKSQVEFEPLPNRKPGSTVVVVTLPEWLATDKGLV